PTRLNRHRGVECRKMEGYRFFVAVNSPLPPFLVVVFTNPEPAREVFAGLTSKVGQDDEEELLRVSIVEGTFHGTPLCGPDIGNVLKHFQVELAGEEYEDFVAVSRVNRMNHSG